MPHTPLLALVIGVVATRYDFDLTILGVALACLTIVDSLWDIGIGLAGDRWRSHWGTRKLMMAAGSALAVFVGLVLYFPRDDFNVLLFIVLFAVFNLSTSLFHISYESWATSLTRDSRSRDKLYFVLAALRAGGALCLAAVPLLPFFGDNQLTVETLTFQILVFAFITPPILWAIFLHFDDKPFNPYHIDRQRFDFRRSTEATFQRLFRNRPFRVLVAVNAARFIAVTLGGSLFFFWFDSYLDLGQYISQTFFAVAICGATGSLLGLWLTSFMARKKLLVICLVLDAATGVARFFLTPEFPHLLTGYFTLLCAGTIFTVVTIAALSAHMADVVDYGRAEFGREDAGLYISTNNFISKVLGAVVGGLGFVAVGVFGLQPGAETQPQTGELILRVLYSICPAVFSLIASAFLFAYPLNPTRMAEISERLVQAQRPTNN